MGEQRETIQRGQKEFFEARIREYEAHLKKA